MYSSVPRYNRTWDWVQGTLLTHSDSLETSLSCCCRLLNELFTTGATITLWVWLATILRFSSRLFYRHCSGIPNSTGTSKSTAVSTTHHTSIHVTHTERETHIDTQSQLLTHTWKCGLEMQRVICLKSGCITLTNSTGSITSSISSSSLRNMTVLGLCTLGQNLSSPITTWTREKVIGGNHA